MDDQAAELIALQKSGLLDDLWNNPKTRGPLQQLMKQQRPDLSIPEVDVPAQIEPRLRRIEAREQAMDLRDKHGLSRDEFQEVVTEMSQKGITNFDTAMELRRLESAAIPRNTGHSPMALPNVRELFADPKGWAQRESAKVLDELARNRR